jgi:glycerophosphoryl diester phosphodiesterase
MTNTCLAVAHRGYSSRFPENTIAACRAAISAGADIVEADARFSADGTLFCFHDPDLLRLTGNPALVADSPDAMLRDLRYGGSAPATIVEILAEIKGRAGLLIDVKLTSREIIEALHRAIAQAAWPENIWLGLRSAGQVAMVRGKFADRVRIVALMGRLADAGAFLAEGADALRLWEYQMDDAAARDLIGKAPIWITAGGRPGYPVGDTDAAGLRKILAFGAVAILLNDPALLVAART